MTEIKEETNPDEEPFRINCSIEELQKRSLFVGMPMYGGVCYANFMESMCSLSVKCASMGIRMEHHVMSNESLIPRARNYIMDQFDRSECTHMIFIDADIGFNPDDVICMLAMMSDDSEYDVLGGAYPKKNISWEKIAHAVERGYAEKNPENLAKVVGDYVFNTIDGKGFRIDRPAEMLEIGTGFMMIRKKTLEMFKKAYPSQLYRPDHVRTEHFDGTRAITAYFDCPIDRKITWDDVLPLLQQVANKEIDYDTVVDAARQLSVKSQSASMRYLSEDYMFCQWVRNAGGKIWLAPWMKLQHTGTYTYGGSLEDLASLGLNPTADLDQLKKNAK